MANQAPFLDPRHPERVTAVRGGGHAVRLRVETPSGRVRKYLLTDDDYAAFHECCIEVAGEPPQGFNPRPAAALKAKPPETPKAAGAGTATPRPSQAVVALAAELGVTLSEVVGTGKDGRVTVDDVRAAVK